MLLVDWKVESVGVFYGVVCVVKCVCVFFLLNRFQREKLYFFKHQS